MLGLGLSRLLPSPIRQPVVETATRLRRTLTTFTDIHDLGAKRKPVPAPFRGERVALFGFFGSRTGLGQGARLMQRWMEENGVTREIFDIANLLDGGRDRRRKIAEQLSTFAPTDLILHVNPPVFRDVLRRLPRSLVLASSVIAYWAWELERLPSDWAIDAALCDAIWAPSPFVAESVRSSMPGFPGQILAVPHPVDLAPVPAVSPDKKAAVRASLDIEPDAFVVGYAFTMASNFERKNPIAAIEAFQRAFPTDTNVLLLRCPDAPDYQRGYELLRSRIDADSRIRLIGADAASITDFYHALDVFLSLHRSEGFGLQIVEALQAGLEVVATSWSLSPEIVQRPRFHGIGSTLTPVSDPQHIYSRVSGGRWAEPDVGHAADVLRTIAG